MSDVTQEPMTNEQESEWRDAIRILTPSEVTALMLRIHEHPGTVVRLQNMATGFDQLIAGQLLEPLLHDDIVRRMEKSATRKGRGT